MFVLKELLAAIRKHFVVLGQALGAVFFLWVVLFFTRAYAEDKGLEPAEPQSHPAEMGSLVGGSVAKLEISSEDVEDRVNLWGANYLFMYRDFSGDLTGNFVFQPSQLSVGMHQFALNYNLSEKFFLSASTRYQKNEITLVSNMGPPGAPRQMEFSTEGLSDSQLGLSRQWKGAGHLILSSQISLPTGSYREQTSSGRLVSYPGQLGSGTVDWVPSISFRGRQGPWELSSRLEGRVRTGRNSLGYRLGDEFSASLGGSYWMLRYLAVTASSYFRAWDEVRGFENVDRFNQQVAAAARASSQRPFATGGPTGPSSGDRPGVGTGPGVSPGIGPGVGTGSGVSPGVGTGPGGRSSVGTGGPRSGPPTGGNPGGGNPGGGPGGPASGPGFSSPTSPFQGGPSANTADVFAAPGTRLSAQVGLRSGIYLGPYLMGGLEVGWPIYVRQLGPLEGLNPTWYILTHLRSEF